MSDQEFEFRPDPKGFFLDVFYPGEDARYTIDLLKMECSCPAGTMEVARATRDKRPTESVCKHLKEVEFRLHHAGVRLGRLNLKEAAI